MRNYTVCHYAKCHGPSSNYSVHIERRKANGEEHVPYNSKRPDLIRFNREFIPRAREVGRTAAIEERLEVVRHQTDKDGNDYERKIRKDQVHCFEIRFSASPEAMAEIVASGQLEDWCMASIGWAQREHGVENVVSAQLHMDEETPHLHVTVVPVVQGKSKKQAATEKKLKAEKEKAKAEGAEAPKKKRRYKKKADVTTYRLCADDIFTRAGMRRRQTEYAAAVERFGLRRGEENSPAKHKDLAQFYREQYELQHARLNEVLAELASKELLIEAKDVEIASKDNLINELDNRVQELYEEAEERDKEIAVKDKQIKLLTAGLDDVKEKFDIYSTANDELADEKSTALVVIEQSREVAKEIERAKKEALERIETAPVSFMASKDVKQLSKEVAELRITVAAKEHEIARLESEKEMERQGKEKAEASYRRLQETVEGTQSALERRHPIEGRLLRELASIQITDPKMQDWVLSGETLRVNPYPFRDPATGKRIPEEFQKETEIKVSGKGENSFISICGQRIADFFREIWAAVAAAIGLKRKEEQERRQQQNRGKGFHM